MPIALVTPTNNRPEAFALVEQWMKYQTKFWHTWVVCNDGYPYAYQMDQKVIHRSPGPNEGHSLCMNLAEALRNVPPECDKILVIEDDDYYDPSYIEAMASLLDSAALVGLSGDRYYNIAHCRWKIGPAWDGASLGQTAFTRPVVPEVIAECESRGQDPKVDFGLWSRWRGSKILVPDLPLRLSVKGMPGTPNAGIGRNPSLGQPDADMSVFREWGLPDEYLDFVAIPGGSPSHPPRPTKAVVIKSMADAESGYGRVVEHVGMGLEKLGVPVSYEAMSIRQGTSRFVADRIVAREDDRWILHIRPPQIREQRPEVRLTMWEMPRLPRGAAEALNQARTVVVPSAWGAACLSAAGITTRIRVSPLGFDPCEGLTPAAFPDGPFTVGMAAKLGYGSERKNLDAGIAAWVAAFPTGDRRLEIKVSETCRVDTRGDHRIRVVRDMLPAAEMAAWYRRLHVLFVPARCEGWGMHTLEAMACGRPVIAAAWSGTTEFWDRSCGWDLPYRLESPASGVFAGQGVWAEPDRDGMVKALRAAESQWRKDREGFMALADAAAIRAGEFTWKRSCVSLVAHMEEAGMLIPPRMLQRPSGPIRELAWTNHQ